MWAWSWRALVVEAAVVVHRARVLCVSSQALGQRRDSAKMHRRQGPDRGWCSYVSSPGERASAYPDSSDSFMVLLPRSHLLQCILGTLCNSRCQPIFLCTGSGLCRSVTSREEMSPKPSQGGADAGHRQAKRTLGNAPKVATSRGLFEENEPLQI